MQTPFNAHFDKASLALRLVAEATWKAMNQPYLAAVVGSLETASHRRARYKGRGYNLLKHD